ncbi:alpha-ribazole phosphatase [Balneicella halophila]|uniref:Alpha-ribazole phosphatase n=1 Tax=Balneicella halophila TaxID=1537566 RepID=A0A7L4UQ48_BALHA|nr:alpha-ribazole phosphatase family protein [Balneicella halophila]PVX51880.1 alpha-ribazole phosphatase [Balneicella halophila]
MSTFYDNIFDKEIFLIRHPKTVAGNSYCYGASDVAVDDKILEETAKKVKAKLEGLKADICYSSPLIRAHSLAKCLFPEQEIVLEDKIREVDFGDWEGVSWEEIPIDAQKRWGDDVLNFKEHGGENFNDLKARVVPFWEEILHNDKEKTVVVAHAGVIVATLSHLLQANPSKVFMLDISFGSVVRIQIKGGTYFKIKIL